MTKVDKNERWSIPLKISCPVPGCDKAFYYTTRASSKNFLYHIERNHKTHELFTKHKPQYYYKKEVEADVHEENPKTKHVPPKNAPVRSPIS